MKRRLMAVLMAGVIAAGILTGCGKTEKENSNQSAGAEIKWTMPVRDWAMAYSQILIYFADRLAA